MKVTNCLASISAVTSLLNIVMKRSAKPIPWLMAGEEFPAVSSAWGDNEPAPGLLAAGGELDAQSLMRAYIGGIFPWFSLGQPILWWSTDPRMVLFCADFRISHSLRKKLRQVGRSTRNENMHARLMP